MKLLLFILALALPAQAASEALISALIEVESRGNAYAVGDNGRAFGALQVHAIAVRDVNRVYGTRYTHGQMLNPAIAKQVCRLYLAHYATPARIGRAVTDEIRARCWNGGPRGWLKPATRGYWRKVSQAMTSKAVANLRTAIQ